MKVTIAQLNPTVGNIEGNLARIRETLSETAQDSPDLVVFPELFLVGYPPKDLLEMPWFIRKVGEAVERLRKVSKEYPKTGVLLGLPVKTGRGKDYRLYNSAMLVCNGQILLTQHKTLLPTYDVFDEARYFSQAQSIKTVKFKGEVLGVSICEDAWNYRRFARKNYNLDPISILAKQGATLLINISASPFHLGKEALRYRLMKKHALKLKKPFIFVNQVGANDDLIFDGRSMSLGKNGKPAAVLPAFKERVETIDTKAKGMGGGYKTQDKIESLHQALVLGIGDYARKCGFKKTVVGLSGGIDSAVTCCLAAEAVGQGNVLGVTMPGPYSSKGSVIDSKKLAERLGIRFAVIPIGSIYREYLKTLSRQFCGRKKDAAEENIQARIRGNILMALSNKFGYLLLSTGNKSELAVGYCTLYGDMSGGLAVISDVPKTMVYKLAEHINKEKDVIPRKTMEKAPSAELKPHQTDRDTLPPYEILDGILHSYIDEKQSIEEIIKKNINPATVKWVIKTINKNEYKRRQAAPGLKVTTKAFGTGRRMPIAAAYEEK